MATPTFARFKLLHMSRIHVVWIIFRLLRRHTRGIRRSGDTSRAQLRPLNIVLAQSRLSVVELPVSAMTLRHTRLPLASVVIKHTADFKLGSNDNRSFAEAATSALTSSPGNNRKLALRLGGGHVSRHAEMEALRIFDPLRKFVADVGVPAIFSRRLFPPDTTSAPTSSSERSANRSWERRRNN